MDTIKDDNDKSCTTTTTTTTTTSISDIIEKQRHFVNDRDWAQYHTPKNLVMALTSEVGELSELFMWNDNRAPLEGDMKDKVSDEIADVMLYLLRIADVCEIDVIDACVKKMDKNKSKYPVEKCFGKSLKYTEL